MFFHKLQLKIVKSFHLYRGWVCSAIVEGMSGENRRTFQGDLQTCSHVGSVKSLCRIQVGSCDMINILYENCSNLSIFFGINWTNSTLLIFLVILYKCKFLGLTCGECLLLSNHYRCGWCSDKCEVHADCSNADWYIEPYVCPNVQITNVSIMFLKTTEYRGFVFDMPFVIFLKHKDLILVGDTCGNGPVCLVLSSMTITFLLQKFFQSCSMISFITRHVRSWNRNLKFVSN